MSEPKFTSNAVGSNAFKEAVCIDAGRIYDSCSDKDCLEDLKVYFTRCEQSLVDDAVFIKAKDVEVINVYIDVEPIPFNRGFFSVDITYFFAIKFEVFTCPTSKPKKVAGLAIFTKKCILFGSESNVQVFTTDEGYNFPGTHCSHGHNSLPKVKVQVAQPVLLGSRVVEKCHDDNHDCDFINVPEDIAAAFEGDFDNDGGDKIVYVTIGVFSIVQLIRDVQMLIPAYDFCVPDKECSPNSDDPCDLFKKIKFPTDEFFPPRLNECDDDLHSGCK